MFDHQKKAVEFIDNAEHDETETNRAYMLCDHMGLGKTRPVVESIFDSDLQGKTLIVVPSNALKVWETTIEEVAPMKENHIPVHIIYHTNSEFVPLEDVCIMIISYAVIQKMHSALKNADIDSFITAKFIFSYKWLRIVFDEIHTVRSSHRKTHEACRSLNALIRGGVSATPIHNGAEDLRSIGSVLHVSYVSKLIGMKMLKRTITDVAMNDDKFELPPLEEIVIKAPFESDEERYNYIVAIRQFDSSIQGLQTSKPRALEIFSRLRMSSVSSCCIGGLRPNMITSERTYKNTKSTKMRLLVRTLDESPSDDFVVFSEWTSALEVALVTLEDAGFTTVGKVVGGTNIKTVDRIIDDLFARKQRNHPRVLLASLRSFYQAVNWQRFNKVIFIEPPLNPQVRNQATSRVLRIGQTRNVTQIMLIIAGSVEERVMGILDVKQNIATHIFGEPSRIREVLIHNLAEMLETQPRIKDTCVEEEESSSVRNIVRELGEIVSIEEAGILSKVWIATDVDDWLVPETCIGLPLPVVITPEGEDRKKYDSPFACRTYRLRPIQSMKTAKIIRISSPSELMRKLSSKANSHRIDDNRFHCGRLSDVANAFRHHLCGEVVNEVRPSKISVWGFMFDDGAVLILWPLRIFSIM